jgi:hypothetical protein
VFRQGIFRFEAREFRSTKKAVQAFPCPRKKPVEKDKEWMSGQQGGSIILFSIDIQALTDDVYMPKRLAIYN